MLNQQFIVPVIDEHFARSSILRAGKNTGGDSGKKVASQRQFKEYINI